MNIREFASSLQKIHEEISFTFTRYQTQTGLQCLPGCGRCCLNPEVESTPLDMIPMALAIYDEGKLEEWMEKIKTSKSSYCHVYVPGERDGEGKCGRYRERPSLCRMFGVAGYYNKNKEIVLSICRVIKENYGQSSIPSNLNAQETPVMSDWSLKLTTLDPSLIHERVPINNALLKALEKVAFYMSYENTKESN